MIKIQPSYPAGKVRASGTGIGDVVTFRVANPGYPNFKYGRVEGFTSKPLTSYPTGFLAAIGLPARRVSSLPDGGRGTLRVDPVPRLGNVVSGVLTSYKVKLMSYDGLDQPGLPTIEVPTINCATLMFDSDAYNFEKRGVPLKFKSPFLDPKKYLNNLLSLLTKKSTGKD